MDGIFFEAAGAQVAVQTLVIVVTACDTNWIGRLADVLHVNPRHAAKLIFQRTVNRVIGVAGVTGHVRRNSVILKMRGGDVAGIIDVQASSIRHHGVAGRTELSLLGALDLRVHPSHEAKGWEEKKPYEGEDLAYRAACY